MKLNFDENWLEQAIQIEDSVNGEISAGLDLGQHTGEYLAMRKSRISREKMAEILEEKLGNILECADYEDIIDATQSYVDKKIRMKIDTSKTA